VKLSFFYSHVKEVAEGIVVDHPCLGGTRTKGHFAGDGKKSGAEHDDPSSAAFMSRAWFKYFIETEDTAPNKPKEKGSVQIGFMEKRELYDEYVMAMQYCLGPGESVLSYDQWIDMWDQDFSVLAIVEYKSVDSKVYVPTPCAQVNHYHFEALHFHSLFHYLDVYVVWWRLFGPGAAPAARDGAHCHGEHAAAPRGDHLLPARVPRQHHQRARLLLRRPLLCVLAPRSHDLQSPGRRHTGVRIVVT
jgi:hypothetical protein